MAAEWFYTTKKQQMGPVSWMDLRELADTGILKPHDMVWTEGMEEWVKAVQQRGLFAHGDGGGRISATKLPPGRRGRRTDEDELDEDDDVRSRKKAKKRAVERTKMTTGLKVGLILGGVVCGLFVLGCAGTLMVWLAVRDNPAPAPKAAPNFVPAPPRVQSYTVRNLMPNSDNQSQFDFRQGQRVIIDVINALPNPDTDVNLFVHPKNDIKETIVMDVNPPNVNRNCHVDFIVPATQSYTIRVVNLGPGTVPGCQVRIEER